MQKMYTESNYNQGELISYVATKVAFLQCQVWGQESTQVMPKSWSMRVSCELIVREAKTKLLMNKNEHDKTVNEFTRNKPIVG